MAHPRKHVFIGPTLKTVGTVMVVYTPSDRHWLMIGLLISLISYRSDNLAIFPLCFHDQEYEKHIISAKFNILVVM